MMRFIAQYCVPVGWIGFYLYHAIRLSNPSSKVKNQFANAKHYSPNQVPIVLKCIAIGAWLGVLLTALSMLAEMTGMAVNSSLTGFFCACILLLYILIVHLCARSRIK